MPSLRDIPGKNLVTDTTKRAKVIAGAASAGAVAVGGLVAKRVLGGHGEKDADASVDSDPIAQTPTAPPGAVEKPTPPTKAAAPKPAVAPKPPRAKVEAKAAAPKPPKAKPAPKGKVEAKPAAAKAEPKAKAKAAPKPAEAKPTSKAKAAPKAKPAAKPKTPAKSKPKAAAKPPKTTGTDATPKPSVEPGNISGDKEPHHALNNPAVDPDETEYPDPFEKRDDPRDPVDPDGEPFGEEPHPATGSESTSEPPLSQDPAISDGGKPPKREKLDD
jgi:hypothetical protein